MNTSKKAKVSSTPISTAKLKSPKIKTPAVVNSETPAKLNSQTAKQNGNTTKTPKGKTLKVNTPRNGATPKSTKKITPQITENIIEEPLPKKLKSDDLSEQDFIAVKQTQVFSASPVEVRHSNSYTRPTFPNKFGNNKNIYKRPTFPNKFQNNKNIYPRPTFPNKFGNNKNTNRSRQSGVYDTMDHENRTISLRNLSNETTISDLQEMFVRFGEIVSIKITCSVVKELNMRKIKINGKKFESQNVRVSGYVVFKSEEDAIKAVVVNGNVIKGYHVEVMSNRIEKHVNFAVYVENLPENVEIEVVRQLFADCGVINYVHKYFATFAAVVYFNTADAVELALGLDGCEIEDCKIKISKAAEHEAMVPKGPTIERQSWADRIQYSVFIHDIPLGTNAFEIKQFFKSVPGSIDVKFMKDKVTGKEMNRGFVNFDSAVAVEQALKLDGKMFKNIQPLRVKPNKLIKPISEQQQRGLKRDVNGAAKNTSNQVEAEESDNENVEDSEEEKEDDNESVEDDEEEMEDDEEAAEDEEAVEDEEAAEDDEAVVDEDVEDNEDEEDDEEEDEEENNEDSDVSDDE